MTSRSDNVLCAVDPHRIGQQQNKEGSSSLYPFCCIILDYKMISRQSFTMFLRRGGAPTGRITTTPATTMLACCSPRRRLPPFTAHAAAGTRFLHIEKRIEELGFQLPPPAPPRANYNSVCWSSGNTILYVSGHLPFNTAGTELTKGRIGEGGRDVEYGYQAARQVALGLVATLKNQLGDLDRVEQIVKVSMCMDGGWRLSAFRISWVYAGSD